MAIMSRVLSELLGASEPGFSQLVQSLEQAGSHQSIDVRLSSELITTAQQKSHQLGFDAQDTTGQELYHALLIEVGKVEDQLMSIVGNINYAGSQVGEIFTKFAMAKNCWAVKLVVAKKMLKQDPPRGLMKHLGYRSVDSLLKRENIFELHCATRFTETKAWQRRLASRYKTLRTSDFETRHIEIIVLDPANWSVAAEFAANQKSNIICDKLLGSIAVLPFSTTPPRGIIITLITLLANCVQQIRYFSAYCRLQQVRADFGSLVSNAVSEQTGQVCEIAGYSLSWEAFLYHCSRRQELLQSEFLVLHIEAADLDAQTVTHMLGSAIPELQFWEDTTYLGVNTADGPVSYNLLDVCLNYCNNRTYPNRIVGNMREALWRELGSRYLSCPQLEHQVLTQLEAKLINPSLSIKKQKRKK